ncbi:hypothetical protein D5272_00045 [bacterium D16-76]|nr:hypothetical protein [bacterium D16-76]
MILTAKKFSLFKDWNIDMILFSRELCSCYPLVNLGIILTPRKEKFKPKDIPQNRRIVSKIRFSDGKVFFKDRVVKNDMTKSCQNDLLVSNINFEKGAFSVNKWGDVYASTDYTSYIIDTTQIIPEYLCCALRCDIFMSYVSSVKPKGMKTRARYDFIKNFEIPVPPIPIQEELLKSYHNTFGEADTHVMKGDSFSNGLLYGIQSKVSGLKKPEQKENTSSSIMQIIPFTSTRRWEVDYILKEGRLESIHNSFKCPVSSISDITIESLFGLSIKASLVQKKDTIPMLRMANIVNGEIDCNGLKYLPRKCAITDKEPDKWLLRKGDFLINRTNSKELVGKSAVFNLDGEYTYASYVIRYRFDTTKVLPEYVNILFMLPIVRIQIDTLSRQTAGQCNINSDEIGAIKIPVPSIPEQEALIKKYYSTKDGANAYYKKASELRAKASSDFERAIFV